MPRLHRPRVPVEARCRVAMRQLGELWPDEALKAHAGGMQSFLDRLLEKLARLLAAEKLHLDHDPPLAARQRKGEGKNTVYTPAACDPEFLVYRSKENHDVKTRIRGDHGQYSDHALIRREKRRQRKAGIAKHSKAWPNGAKRSAAGAAIKQERERRRIEEQNAKGMAEGGRACPIRKWPSRPFPKGRGFPKRAKQ